jgi:hypothetical protein
LSASSSRTSTRLLSSITSLRSKIFRKIPRRRQPSS